MNLTKSEHNHNLCFVQQEQQTTKVIEHVCVKGNQLWQTFWSFGQRTRMHSIYFDIRQKTVTEKIVQKKNVYVNIHPPASEDQKPLLNNTMQRQH